MTNAVVVRGLAKRFGARAALDGIDLELAQGEFLSLFGPNGAGKTTLVRILATLARPTAGDVSLLGHDLHRAPAAVRSRIGVVSHHSFLYGELSGRENLDFYAGMYSVSDRRAAVDRAAEAVALSDRLDDPVRTYSRGLTQRCAIARALVHDPELLLLDEPFSGLDPVAAEQLAELLRDTHRGGRTVLMTSHDLRRGLDLADRVAILRAGRLAHLGPATSAADLEAAYRGVVGAAGPANRAPQ